MPGAAQEFALRNSDEGYRHSHYDILSIALAIMLSDATVPLIGFADTAIIG